MARYLKNTQLKGGGHAAQLPIGSSAVGPSVPVDGLIRFNKTNNSVEFYYNSTWNQIAKVGTVPIVVDEFVGDNSQVNFTMSQAVAAASDIIVTISGIFQAPTNNYTVSGFTLSFTSPPPAVDASGNPNKVIVLHNFNSTSAV